MKHTHREISGQTDVGGLDKKYHERLQSQLREADRLYSERLCQRYRELVPPDRIRAIQDVPIVFEDREHFQQSYLRATGQEPADNVVGFTTKLPEPAHVATDHLQMRKTIIHERLHQLSDPHSAERLGRGLDEGITEDLAIKELRHEWNPELPRSYPHERAIAHQVRELCGDEALEHAYFQGDTRELRTCLDRCLGKDSLDKLEQMADQSAPVDVRDQASG